MLRLTAIGLKARDIDVQLGARAFCVGPNGVGKSALIDALSYAACGFVPRLGRALSATAALLRDRELTVRVALDDTRWFERTLKRKPKGGYESTCRASWVDSPRSEEHEAEVLALFGASAEDVAEVLDIRELLSLTGNQRAARIQALLEQGIDTDALTLAVARRWVQLLSGVDDEHLPADHLSLRPLIQGYGGSEDGPHAGVYARLVDVADQFPAKITEVGIGGALTWANEKKRFATAAIKPKLQARDELAARQREIPEPDLDEMARLEAQRQELDRQVGAAQERDAAVKRHTGGLTAAQDAVELAQHRADKAVAERAAFERDAAELPAQKAQLEAIAAELAGLAPPTPPDFAEADAQQREAERAEVAARAIELPAVPDLGPLERAVTAASAALKVAEESPWTRVQKIAEDIRDAVTRGASKGRPNLVGYIEQTTGELQELAAKYGAGDVEALGRAYKEALGALADAESDAANRRDASATLAVERDMLLEAAKAARAAATDMRVGRTENYNQERALFAERRDALTAEEKRLRTATVAYGARDQATAEAVRTTAAALDAARARLADLRETTTGTTEAEPGPTLADLEAERARIAGQLASLARAKAVHEEFGRLVAEIDKLQASKVVYEALESSLQHVRAQEIAHGGGKLVGILSTVLAAAGRDEVPYIRAEKGVCELGWRGVVKDAEGKQDVREVAIQALSGAEYALYASALSAAVSILRGAPVRLLLVESAEAVDHPQGPASLSQLLAGLSAVSDWLTATVVLSPSEPSAPAEGWQVVRMTAAERQAVAA